MIALKGPGLPSKGTPSSRALGPAWAMEMEMENADNSVRMLRSARNPLNKSANLAGTLAGIEHWGRHAISNYDVVRKRISSATARSLTESTE
ncbi:MAG TPA: hypothetical protein VLD67_15355 [Vicinamibacterales bacterium]|nr:hypothetical protein [Vicinamibacterales bacterium]